MFLGNVMCIGRSFGQSVFYIVDDESLPSNELVCDLIIGRSLIASSDYYHMDMRLGQLYNDNNDRIQCAKVEIQSIMKNDREKKMLMPVFSSPLVPINNNNTSILKSCIPNITDNMRNNKAKFNLTTSQLEKMRQHDRHQRMRKYISSSSSLSSESEMSDMLGLPIHINNVDVRYGLVDQGASSGIITRSLMNSTQLKVREYDVRNHGLEITSG